MYHIFSTLANDTRYCDYTPGDSGLARIHKEVAIKGGAGVANHRIVTPIGVCTTISDDDYEFLQGNEAFEAHVKSGFIQVRKDNVDPEVAVADMEARDKSAPLVPQDYEPKDEDRDKEKTQRATPIEESPKEIKAKKASSSK